MNNPTTNPLYLVCRATKTSFSATCQEPETPVTIISDGNRLYALDGRGSVSKTLPIGPSTVLTNPRGEIQQITGPMVIRNYTSSHPAIRLGPGEVKYFETFTELTISHDRELIHACGPRKILGRDGSLRYYKDYSKLHREDGPAIISPNGGETFYLNDSPIFKEELPRNPTPFKGPTLYYTDNKVDYVVGPCKLFIKGLVLKLEDGEVYALVPTKVYLTKEGHFAKYYGPTRMNYPNRSTSHFAGLLHNQTGPAICRRDSAVQVYYMHGSYMHGSHVQNCRPLDYAVVNFNQNGLIKSIQGPAIVVSHDGSETRLAPGDVYDFPKKPDLTTYNLDKDGNLVSIQEGSNPYTSDTVYRDDNGTLTAIAGPAIVKTPTEEITLKENTLYEVRPTAGIVIDSKGSATAQKGLIKVTTSEGIIKYRFNRQYHNQTGPALIEGSSKYCFLLGKEANLPDNVPTLTYAELIYKNKKLSLVKGPIKVTLPSGYTFNLAKGETLDLSPLPKVSITVDPTGKFKSSTGFINANVEGTTKKVLNDTPVIHMGCDLWKIKETFFVSNHPTTNVEMTRSGLLVAAFTRDGSPVRVVKEPSPEVTEDTLDENNNFFFKAHQFEGPIKVNYHTGISVLLAKGESHNISISTSKQPSHQQSTTVTLDENNNLIQDSIQGPLILKESNYCATAQPGQDLVPPILEITYKALTFTGPITINLSNPSFPVKRIILKQGNTLTIPSKSY